MMVVFTSDDCPVIFCDNKGRRFEEIPQNKKTTISHSCFWYVWNGPGLTNVDHVEPTAPINIRNESLEGISLMFNLEEEGTPSSVMPQLVFILICHALTLLQTSAEEECQSFEVSKLKEEIRMLNNKLLIGEWKVMHLRAHRKFRLVPNLELQENKPSENNTEPSPTLPSTGGSLLVHDKDCSELYDRLKPGSGFYRIKPKSSLQPFLVYCDMDDGGGWTVIQKRINGKVDFDGKWEDYKNGFGNFQSSKDEFWLGNDHIHALLSGGDNVMKIDLMDWKGGKSYAMYDNVKVSDEKDKYRLHYGMYSGQAGDALSGGTNMVEQWSASHNGMQFSTRDQDHDRYLQGSCAAENKGGWWYNRCHAANLNGRFYRGGEYKAKYDNGVVWSTWKGLWYSLRHTAMKVRPSSHMDSVGSGGGPTE